MKGRPVVRSLLLVLLPAALVFLTGNLLLPVFASAQVAPSPSGSPGVDPSSTATPDPSSMSPSPSPGSSLTDPTIAPTLDPLLGPSPAQRGGKMARIPPRRTRTTHLGSKRLKHAEGRRHGHHRSWKGWEPDPRWGDYGTAILDRAASRSRLRGWSAKKIAERVYSPFIVEGPATWSDSWGAPRWTGGYHPHHGQDVLCRMGAPVLAAQPGTIRFGSDPLGGRVAYLTLGNGSFFYYAHLKSYATLATGDHVHAGQIIGRCGASGDATLPHVHFAAFTPEHIAVDPMPSLVSWLRAAEHRVRSMSDRTPLRQEGEARQSPHPRPGRVMRTPRTAAVDGSAVPPEAVASSPRRRAAAAAAVLIVAGPVGGMLAVRRRRRPHDVGGPEASADRT